MITLAQAARLAELAELWADTLEHQKWYSEEETEEAKKAFEYYLAGLVEK